MSLTESHYYQAIASRDVRFDGRILVGVTSTGIYCRPVCPAKTPKRENCRFFSSAAAAEAAGYRPCLRCRPELAPGNASIDANHRLAQRAICLMEEGFLNDASLAQLAKKLGITDRHLRRIFQNEFGVTPIDFAQTQRLLLAKHLLTDTNLPVIEVALAAGFKSVRRFNALFKKCYQLNPTDLRRDIKTTSSDSKLVFELSYRPPFDWQGLLHFLANRAIPGVEQVSDGVYRRTVSLYHQGNRHSGWLTVQLSPNASALRVELASSLVQVINLVLRRIKCLFDLNCQPEQIAKALGALIADKPGLRVPGVFDGFEMALRAILGQQVSVKAAQTLAGRFVNYFGEAQTTPFSGVTHAFPAPARIAVATLEEITALGVSGMRAKAIIALAQAIIDEGLVLAPEADVTSTLDQLRALPGIGDWTAQYIVMRALAWPDAFLAKDLGVMKALNTRSAAATEAISQTWRPWRAYAVIYFWSTFTEEKRK